MVKIFFHVIFGLNMYFCLYLEDFKNIRDSNHKTEDSCTNAYFYRGKHNFKEYSFNLKFKEHD